MSNTQRQPGYYWVKIITSDWKVAYWDENFQWWEFEGKAYERDEVSALFDEINENLILNPDEVLTPLEEFMAATSQNPKHSLKNLSPQLFEITVFVLIVLWCLFVLWYVLIHP